MNIVTLERRAIGEKKPDLYAGCVTMEFTETYEDTPRNLTPNNANVTAHVEYLIIDGVKYAAEKNLSHTFSLGVHKIGWKFDGSIIYANVFGTVSNSTTSSKDKALITIPSNISEIGAGAMRSRPAYAPRGGVICYAITPPIATTTSIGLWYINSSNKNYVKVPAESVDAYKVANGWSQYASRIIAI